MLKDLKLIMPLCFFHYHMEDEYPSFDLNFEFLEPDIEQES